LVDILITGGTIITMDSERRVIEDGAIAVEKHRLLDVGKSRELESSYTAKQVINASGKIVMPGLFDGHSHAGHGLIKSLGLHKDLWYQACEEVYARGSTEAFWEADALLTALERLRFGVTSSITFMGGGDSVMRTDNTIYGDRHCKAVERVGVREYLAVGPRRPPFPRIFSHWDGGYQRNQKISFEDQFKVCKTLVEKWNEGKVKVCVMSPTANPNNRGVTEAEFEELKQQSQVMRDLSKRYGVIFTQDGHSTGTVKFAHKELGLLGEDALFSHSTGLTDEEIDICVRTGTKIVHNPSAVASMVARCPVSELLNAGVNVMLGSDAAAPDRSYDMFRHIFQCMRYHRRHFRNPRILPPGKVLEMATIDAARAMGVDRELGSLVPGKVADIILIDARKPHMYPLNMAVDRVTYFANGNDVATVLIDGEVLMEDRVVKTVVEDDVLDLAQGELEAVLDRNGLRHLLEYTEGYWGRSRY
jgi:cytosine/adenosine deaminase-related metal-dependent hydrolase